MARNAENTFPHWLHYFDTIDSTNNYAMRLVDDGMAQHGIVVWAGQQTAGRGQRGNTWMDDEGNVKMSLLIQPPVAPDQQFQLSMLVAVTLVQYLQTLDEEWQVAVKWPNDIYINDKKACGILIENVFRGMQWVYAVVGIGLNVNQQFFPEDMPHATSLRMASGKEFELRELIRDIRTGLLNHLRVYTPWKQTNLLAVYNQMLFMRGKEMKFRLRKDQRKFTAFVEEVDESGQLLLLTHKGIEGYSFGELEWLL